MLGAEHEKINNFFSSINPFEPADSLFIFTIPLICGYECVAGEECVCIQNKKSTIDWFTRSQFNYGEIYELRGLHRLPDVMASTENGIMWRCWNYEGQGEKYLVGVEAYADVRTAKEDAQVGTYLAFDFRDWWLNTFDQA